MSEIIDIYDENMQLVGVKERDAVHRDGDWHRSFHCWVVGEDEAGGFVVFQRRSASKDTFPNMLDISAAGHYLAGETAADGGLREIEEELGLSVTADALIPVGLRISTCLFGAVHDYEFNEVYLLRCDQPLTAYAPSVEEVSQLVKVPVSAALRLFAGECESISAEAIPAPDNRIELRLADFIHVPDHYTYRALILAQRYFNHESHLLI